MKLLPDFQVKEYMTKMCVYEPSHDNKFDTLRLRVALAEQGSHMFLIKLIVYCSGYLMYHGKLHPYCIGTGNDC